MKQFKTDMKFDEEKFIESLYFYPNNNVIFILGVII